MTIAVTTPTSVNSSGLDRLPYQAIEDEAIVVDFDIFTDVLSYDNREYVNSIIQIDNTDANALDYIIYGHVDANAGVIPAFTTATWKELKASTTLAATKVAIETLTDEYSWVLIRMKETVSTSDSVASIWIRAFKS